MTIGTMEYVLPVNAHGQITLPKAIRQLFNIEPGETEVRITATDEKTALVQRAETIEEVLADLDAKKSPAVRAAIERNRDKTAAELRDEYASSEAGQAYYREKYGL